VTQARTRAPAESWRDGPGKTAQIVLWRNGAAVHLRCKWGLKPAEMYGNPVHLLRSEGRAITNPCLVIASWRLISRSMRAKFRGGSATRPG